MTETPAQLEMHLQNDTIVAGVMSACLFLLFRCIKNSGKVGYGFNALTEEYADMLTAGIVDPTKVTRSALQNAASVASMVLTTESLVADIKEPTPPAPPAPDMGGMY